MSGLMIEQAIFERIIDALEWHPAPTIRYQHLLQTVCPRRFRSLLSEHFFSQILFTLEHMQVLTVAFELHSLDRACITIHYNVLRRFMLQSDHPPVLAEWKRFHNALMKKRHRKPAAPFSNAADAQLIGT